MINKIISKSKIIAVAVFLTFTAFTGVAAAFNLAIMQASPNQATPALNPITLPLGGSVTLSLKMDSMVNDGDVYPVTCTLSLVSGVDPAPLEPTFTCPVSLSPAGSDPFTATDVITVNANLAPAGNRYNLVVDAAGTIATTDIASASRFIDIPEFATIALPMAAIFGLVYVLKIRKKEH